ncbi:MAG TPA: sigma-70 family RNA polymerase sigma factor [Chryseolinea sp.]|nr:sigma-70 family RNA polymerase sigma factor [Chryseolinea sp.]
MFENHNHLAVSEQILIRGCIAGERSFQTKLYDKFAPKMLGVCMRYARSREEAEEILHEGFLRVFTYIKSFEGSGSFEGWIRKIMVNSALARYRNKIHLSPLFDLSSSDTEVSSSPDAISDLSAKELLAMVQKLPAAYRLVFNLHVFEGFKHREIAEALGISEGTSKSNLSDARAILQRLLNPKKKLASYQ